LISFLLLAKMKEGGFVSTLLLKIHINIHINSIPTLTILQGISDWSTVIAQEWSEYDSYNSKYFSA
jgi:hypothetical protein